MNALFAGSERLMGMSDAVWLRHANPLSGWSRFGVTLPLLIAAVWSRVWIGWWALAPVALALAWIWVNPRLFPAPRAYGAWMSRAVLGERLWIVRGAAGVPAHHRGPAHVATAAAALGGLAMLWGLAVLDPWAAVLGAALAVAGKAWFCDRMVWLHAEVTGIPPGAPMPRPIPFDTTTGETT